MNKIISMNIKIKCMSEWAYMIQLFSINLPFENQGDYVPLHQKSLGCQGGKSNIVINEKGMVRPCNMLPSYLFSEYSLERYINDVKHGIERNYELDLENVRRYMERNGKKAEDMKCSGFCHVR